MSETRHNRSIRRPTRISIMIWVAATALAMTATAWVTTGPVYDGRHLVGTLVGLVATLLLAAHCLAEIIHYNHSRPQVGVWVKMNPNKYEEIEVEVTIQDWADRAELLRALTELESDGYQPINQEDTLRMRRELGMPEWSR